MVSSFPHDELLGPVIETRDTCTDTINREDAETFIELNKAMWKREKGWQKLAKGLYDKDFQLYSNAVPSSFGGDINDQPVYKSRAEFVKELETRIPSTAKQSTVGFWVDCHELIWLRRIGEVAGKSHFVTQDMSVFSMQRTKAGSWQVKSARVEYDSIPWGRALGGTYTPPPASKYEDLT
ncbi:hypothetical protein CLAFUW4_10590 [Fulvia fulva]|uniref:NTF2-like domain-containing protein n=1 Tax=Passalora fulva TaxID=5499 RepID=A0A9Q8LFF2_PASFU|nr:uncharacterized protein CLAFUR5_05204 [Fulvia fulva]KAK4615342.1 hypothetical protein CLAFUR4_10595 [Fulvia fulva]KAK4616802.1 hypothetical protein CLAFUR0_10649 [Fulvia fulva]UJO16407.1 hypothetical protein CLAFUR5_05204 [Fulvia fulva]WPV18815.1 hypothetical protein CLAFUW4_10590 [Fulvia fulva]WPV34631.1 hypothetical protein CLAFUW7_10592 [Fulvia fulva]